MSISDPQTPEEWELFRFPPRVIRKPQETAKETEGLEDEDEKEKEKEGEGETGGEMELEMEFPPGPRWEYDKETGFLMNLGLKKKIDLKDLDDAHKIVRTMTVFQVRPDLSFPSLRRALEAAAQHRFGVSVEDLLCHYAGGQQIPWKSAPQPSRGSSSGHP